MVVYDIDRNGSLPLWSPYAGLNTLKELEISMLFPFPTGKTTNFVETKNANDIKGFLRDFGPLFKIRRSKKTGKVLVYLNDWLFNTSRGVSLIKDLLSLKLIPRPDKTTTMDVIKNMDDVIGKDKIIKFLPENADEVNAIFDGIGEIIDKHNLYLKDLPKHKLDLIVNNMTVNSLYNVIKDPANLVQAQTPVDEATEPLKKIANDPNLPAAKRLLERTSGNVVNKFESVNENFEGKDCIAISAVGIKGYFTLTQYTNEVLNNGDENAQKRLIGRKGNLNVILSNVRAKNPATVTNLDVLDMLVNIKDQDDEALVLSALLSLSTDNAKELSLAKLNAGSLMISCYLYGISVGMDFKEVSKLLMSPTGLVMRNILSTNVMSGTPGYSTLKQGFDYFDKGPTKHIRLFGSVAELQFVDIFKPKNPKNDKENYYTGASVLKAFVNRLIAKGTSLDNILEQLEVGKLKFNLPKPTVYSSREEQEEIDKLYNKQQMLYYQLIDFCKEYAYNRYSINDLYKNVQSASDVSESEKARIKGLLEDEDPIIFTDYRYIKNQDLVKYLGDYERLKELCWGAEEMRTLGQIAGFNLGIKTSLVDFINQCGLIENIMKNWDDAIKNGDELVFVSQEKFEQFDDPRLVPEEYRNDGMKIDLYKFAHDEAYRERAIGWYEKALKTSFNVLDAVSKLPHISKYIEIIACCDKMLLLSYKYRSIKNYYKRFVLKGMNSKNVINGIANYVGDSTINQWLLDRNLGNGTRITIGSGNYVFSPYGIRSKETTNAPVEVRLGTDYGNATFRMWMENKVIPDLKEQFKNDKFILKIGSSSKTNTTSRNGSVVRTLDLNMLPRSNDGKLLLDTYRDYFDRIDTLGDYVVKEKDSDGNNVEIGRTSIKDLFILYCLIAHNGKLGENSLMGILQNQLQTGLLREFHEYESLIDKSDLTLDTTNFENDIAPYIAARGQAKGGYSWIYDNESGLYRLEYFSNWKPSQTISRADIETNYFPNSTVSEYGRLYNSSIEFTDTYGNTVQANFILRQTANGFEIVNFRSNAYDNIEDIDAWTAANNLLEKKINEINKTGVPVIIQNGVSKPDTSILKNYLETC